MNTSYNKHELSDDRGTLNVSWDWKQTDTQTRNKGLQSEKQQGTNRRGRGKKTLDCLLNTEEKGERNGGDRGTVSMSWLLWDFLPHLKTLESPLLWWWWWKQLVLNRSEACLPFCPLLTSLPLPLQTSSHPSSHSPSWVLLKLSERPSAPGSSQGRGGGNSTLLSLVVVVVVVVHRAKRPGAIQFYTQQHKHNRVIVLIPAGLLLNPPGWQACQSLSNLPASLTLTLSVSREFPSDLSGHISAASLVCASCPESRTFTGRVLLLGLGQVEHFLSTGVANRRSW